MLAPFTYPVEFLPWSRDLTDLVDDFKVGSVYPNLPPYYDPLHFRFNQDSPCYAPSIVSSSIFAAQSLLVNYEEIASQIQRLQSLVQEQIQSVKLYIQNCKSLISPVRSLPPDIIDLVAGYTASQTRIDTEHFNYDPIVRFSHVSSTWRPQVLNYPLWWSKFNINIFPIPNRAELRRVLDRIEVFVSRSHPMPLHITIDHSSPVKHIRDTGLELELNVNVPPIFKAMLRASDRLQTLNLTSSFLYPEICSKMNLPSLVNLSMENPDSYSPRSSQKDNINAILLAAPRLNYIRVEGLYNCDYRRVDIPWERLSGLTVLAHAFVDWIMTQSLTHLTTLDLHGPYYRSFPDRQNLPLLDTLCVTDFRVLARLDTPQLTSLTVAHHNDNTVGFCNTIQEFLVFSACSTRLRRLTISFVPAEIPHAIHLFQVLPELDSLDLQARLVNQDWSDCEDSSSCEGEWGGKDYVDEYLGGFAGLFNAMSLHNSSLILLPKLKYLILRCPRFSQHHELPEMIESRCDPGLPHRLVRLELWLRRAPGAVHRKTIAQLMHDWRRVQMDLLRMMKEGMLGVNIYNSVEDVVQY